MIATLLLAVSIILISSRVGEAQDQSPPLKMLLDLDLFTGGTGAKRPGEAPSDNASTLEQLRALRSMGYFSADGPLPDDDSDAPLGAATLEVPTIRGKQQ